MRSRRSTVYFPASRSRKLLVIVLAVLCMHSFSLFAVETLLSTDYLYLNTTIEANSYFVINGADAENNVALTLGEPSPPLSYTFNYTGTNTVSVTITSSNPDGTQMRLKHLEADAYIPYVMKLDYDGNGPMQLQTVVHGLLTDLVTYTDSYDNVQGTIVFETPTDDSYLAGDYKDTITFSFTGI